MDPGTAMQFRRGLVCRAVGSATWLAFAAAASIVAGAEKVDFSRDIQPLLAKRCVACHGPDTREGGLRLDDQTGATRQLDSGARAVVAGDSAASAILARITSTDPDVQMPPEGARLTPAQVDALRRWIDEGAEWKEHWAFRPLARPDVPAVPGVGNPIDAFIRVGLERRGLAVPRPAEKVALLRRATYDVTGLPPSEQEVRDFLADESPQAWERVVDRLLASPHYGEQWARHWLDLVRYADTNSFERDGNKPHAWRYRDYVIRSLNDDKPYDRFIIEQLAGDELPQPSPDDLIATGYYRLGIWDDEPADREQARYDWLDDVVSTTGQTFLGLSIGCARCHDHKIDPLTQRDYYALLAFFENITPMGDRHMNPAFIERPIATDAMSDEEARHRAEDLDRRRQEARREISAVEKRIKEQGDQALDDLAKADLSALRNRLASLDTEHAGIARALVVSEYGTEPKPTHVFYRGNPHAERTPENRVEPAFPAVLRAPQPEITPLAEAETTGRRTVLAKWIASPDNPLTTRVMANRIWQHHFGRGIVRSPSNFGFAADPPTHPELLDWLAVELVANGWRLKPLHKRILMSDAYRGAATCNAEAFAKDPLNEAFWRFDMRRLAAEEIRDSIHVASGAFNPKMFGPGVYPRIPQEVMAGQSKPQDAAAIATAAEIARLQAAGPSTPAVRQAAIMAWRQKLTPDELSRADHGRGRVVWRQRCGSCHVLFDEGGNVGPNLTGSGRAEVEYVVLNVMDPSAVVPEAWRLTQVITAEGRVLAGAVVASDDRTLTLRTTTGDVQLDREEIDEVIVKEQSVMPEGLWNGLADDEVRDLVGYLAAPAQVPLPTP